MTPNKIIYKLLSLTGTTQTKFAKMMGYKSQGTVSNRLGRENVTMNTFMEMVDVLGYEVVVRPKGVTDENEQMLVCRGE